MQSLSFATSCCSVRLLPWWVLENPHCGLRARFSIGTYLAAASMRRLRSSFFSSSGNLELTSPSTTFLPLGTKRSGSKPPARDRKSVVEGKSVGGGGGCVSG